MNSTVWSGWFSDPIKIPWQTLQPPCLLWPYICEKGGSLRARNCETLTTSISKYYTFHWASPLGTNVMSGLGLAGLGWRDMYVLPEGWVIKFRLLGRLSTSSYALESQIERKCHREQMSSRKRSKNLHRFWRLLVESLFIYERVFGNNVSSIASLEIYLGGLSRNWHDPPPCF